MNLPNVLPLALGLVLFSFLFTASLVVPFINLLYRLKITRRKEGIGGEKKSLFDRLHDKKAGTPTGGGVILIAIVSLLFSLLLPLIAYLGVFIQSAHHLQSELVVIFFTFIS